MTTVLVLGGCGQTDLALDQAVATLPPSATPRAYTPLLADAAPQASAASAPQTIEAAACPFALPDEIEGEDYACGLLRVPQRRSDAEGLQVGIFFARLNATGLGHDRPPILFLSGGPGASGVYDAPLLAPTLAPLREERDLLFFDIRGSGFSQPRIDCAPFAGADSGAACMDALRAQGIEPMAFNTSQNAADAADLLAALGYAQADLLGVSYGTRLALEMMRSQPQVVRVAVLDSTVAPETLTYELQALGDYEAKLWPFADCEQSAVCRGRFGEVAGRFVALINRLSEGDAAPGIGDSALDAGQLYNITNLALNRPDLLALMPLVVDELDRGSVATYRAILDHQFDTRRRSAARPVYAFDRFVPLLNAYLRSLPDAEAETLRARLSSLAEEKVSRGDWVAWIDANVPASLAAALDAIVASMTSYERDRLRAAYGADMPVYDHADLGDIKTIIDCQEEIPFVDPEAVRKNQAVIPVPSLLPPYDFYDSVRSEQRTCLDMGLTPAPATFKDAVVSDIPVLMLSGTQDTVAPSLWARLAAESLRKARVVLFPAYGHALLYNDGDCTVAVLRSFLENPAREPDTRCVPTIRYVLEQPLRVSLTGRMWRLQGWAGQAAGGLPVTAFFSGDGVAGLGGCSAYDGDFSLDGDRLAVANLDAADERCSEADRALQAAFLDALRQAHSVSIRGERMLLTLASGELLVFALENDLPLEGPVWTLVGAAGPAAGGPLTPALPEAVVTARFDAGVLKGALGCNLVEAAYDLAQAPLLQDVRRTGADVCDQPRGVMEQEQVVLDLLGTVVDYRVAGRELFLYGEASVPLLVFYAE